MNAWMKNCRFTKMNYSGTHLVCEICGRWLLFKIPDGLDEE